MELKVVVDVREKELISKLKDYDFRFQKKQLSVYDVIVDDEYGVELKRGTDFLSSIYDGRIFGQLRKMKEVNLIPIIIVYDVSKIYSTAKNRNAINGMMLSLFYRKIPVMFLGNLNDVIYVIKKMCEKNNCKSKQTEYENVKLPKFRDLTHRKITALSCAGSIGSDKSKKLIEQFGTIENLCKNVDSIQDLEGFGPVISENVKKLLKK